MNDLNRMRCNKIAAGDLIFLFFNIFVTQAVQDAGCNNYLILRGFHE